MSSSSSSSSSSVGKLSTSQRQFIPKKSLEELIVESQRAAVSQKFVVGQQSVADDKYPIFTPPKGEKDMTAKQLCDALLKLGTKSNPVVVPGESLQIPWTLKGFSYTQPAAIHGGDAFFAQLVKNKKDNKYIALGYEASKQLVRCNGTVRGLCTRLTSKLVGTVKLPSRVAPAEVAKIFPIRFGAENPRLKDKDVLAEFSRRHSAFQNLNPKASPGLPYVFECKPNEKMDLTSVTHLAIKYRDGKKTPVPLLPEPMPVLEHAHRIAEFIVKDTMELPPAEMFKAMDVLCHENPELNTMLIKRKDERIEREEYFTKVRPYGVMALPLRLISMYGMHAVENGLLGFWEDPESCSAYHFSPYHGGAERIVAWMEYHIRKHAKSEKPVEFFAIAYGDDQLWCFFYPKEGQVVVVGPDISAMDMSTQGSCASWINRLVGIQVNKQMSITQLNAVTWTVHKAFHHALAVGGPYVVNKTNSLISGIPGTTFINLANSAYIIAEITQLLEKEKGRDWKVENFSDLFKVVVDRVHQVFGYTFKDVSWDGSGKYTGELQWEVTNPARIRKVGLSVPFLGNIIYYVNGRIAVGSKDPSSVVPTLLLPGNGSHPARNRLDRIRGAYISGGWIDPNLSDVLHEFAEYFAKTADKSELETFNAEEVFGDSSVAEDVEVFCGWMTKLKVKLLPTRELMIDFLTLDKPSFRIKYQHRLEPTLVHEAADDAIVQTIVPDYALYDEDDLRTLTGVTSVSSGNTVPLKALGHGNANNNKELAEKKARFEAKKLRWQKLVELRNTALAFKRDNKHSKTVMSAVLDDDETYDSEFYDAYQEFNQEFDGFVRDYYPDLDEDNMIDRYDDEYWSKFADEDSVDTNDLVVKSGKDVAEDEDFQVNFTGNDSESDEEINVRFHDEAVDYEDKYYKL